ncbi:WxL domain-containing protein [Carnobacterium maltaromaticum]|uniref:WxL domain-containing protein n=1 Tax=Carnobacterium maltaromaticum TaxID=2751 RepID=UPI00295F2FE2|nr:WxL domain-containing protein [Carnobacterium maltaromaticum]
MKKVGLFVMFIASVGLFCIRMNSYVYAAESTNSQVGIKFIKGDSEDSFDKDSSGGSTNNDSFNNTGSNGSNSNLPETGGPYDHNLPQTGEANRKWSLTIAGIVSILLGSFIIKNIKRNEEKKMKKSKLVLASVASTFLLSASITASAAVDQNEVLGTDDGKGAVSHGYVKLTAGDQSTGPTEPIEPTIPDGSTGNEGPLTIDNASPLLFGENKIEGGKMVFSTTTQNPNIQVTDKRGEGQGWNLQVKTADFVDQVDTKKVLKGAELSLPVGTVTPAPGNIAVAPTVNAVVLGSTNAKAQTIMFANKNNGLGTWVDKFDASEVKLTVPAGNLVGEYVSTLTWSLLDAPK